jgi:hypothetical protein
MQRINEADNSCGPLADILVQQKKNLCQQDISLPHHQSYQVRLFPLTRTIIFSKRTRAILVPQTCDRPFTCKQRVHATAAPAIPQRIHLHLATAKKKTPRAHDSNPRPRSKKAGSHKDFCSLTTLLSVPRLSFVILCLLVRDMMRNVGGYIGKIYHVGAEVKDTGKATSRGFLSRICWRK